MLAKFGRGKFVELLVPHVVMSINLRFVSQLGSSPLIFLLLHSVTNSLCLNRSCNWTATYCQSAFQHENNVSIGVELLKMRLKKNPKPLHFCCSACWRPLLDLIRASHTGGERMDGKYNSFVLSPPPPLLLFLCPLHT